LDFGWVGDIALRATQLTAVATEVLNVSIGCEVGERVGHHQVPAVQDQKHVEEQAQTDNKLRI